MDFTTEIYFTDYLEHDSGYSGHILLNEYLHCCCKGILTLCRRTDIDRYIDFVKEIYSAIETLNREKWKKPEEDVIAFDL